MPCALEVDRDLHILHEHFRHSVVHAWAERLVDNQLITSRIMNRLLCFLWNKAQPDYAQWRWLYVAHRPADGFLKIGLSESPLRRIAGLSHGGKSGFVPIAVIPYCDLQHERLVIALLDPFVAPGGREWFLPCPEIALFISTVARAKDGYHFDQYQARLGASLDSFARAIRLMRRNPAPAAATAAE